MTVQGRNLSQPPVPSRANWRTGLIGIAISCALIAGLYSQVDIRMVWSAIQSANPWWLAISIGAIVPITLIVALRFYWAAPSSSLPGYGEAIRLVLVATAFNIFLPSKSGDLIKSYSVARRGKAPTGVALSIVVYERLCDLIGLVTWCMVGWIITPSGFSVVPMSGWVFAAAVLALCLVLVSSERSAVWLVATAHWLLPSRRLKRLHDLAAGWPALHRELRGRRRWIVLLSIFLWFCHMIQMWLFTLAISQVVPFATGLGIFALALLAGQLPLTFAGLGARDVTLVVLLSGYMTPDAAAAIGLLSATRGILPALAAAPIARPYLAMVLGEAARWRKKSRTLAQEII